MLTKFLKTILLFLPAINIYAQIGFEPGYILDHQNQRKEVLIKNVDWLNNPKSFEYKLDENSKIETATTHDVSEFGITNKMIYKTSKVLIDYSSEDIRSLSVIINPEFKEETLFLRQLVKGNANLYKYQKGEMIRYFFNSLENPKIEQLIYKMYAPAEDKIDYNYFYRTQILTHFKCPAITKSLLLKVSYTDKRLIDLFEKINQCHEAEVAFVDRSKMSDIKLHMNIRPRLNLNQLTIGTNSLDDKTTKLDRSASFGIGLELELILPFNNNKWSIIVEPNFLSYKSESESTAPITGIKSKWILDYKSIDVPIGIRHSFFFDRQSKLFINGMFVPVFSFNSTVRFERNEALISEMRIGKGFNFGAGIGYTFNKFTGEIRYITDLKRRDNIENKYNNLSIIVGYNLF
ncbi:hypothetical protein [Empedobacter brevis]|uniref:hypothetical protein n=1 Tax=Empedobacter brevis TaxID=247 RepID=UPI00289EBA9C|nr:hypothetical protein [Empedobacter brevis]